MPHNPIDLEAMTDAQLNTLLRNYKSQRRTINRAHSSRGEMLATDISRTTEMVRHINRILRQRSRRGRALREFGP